MKRLLALPGALILAAALAAACMQDQTTTLEPAQPALNKSGGGSTATDPTARFYIPSSGDSVGLWSDGNYTMNHPDNSSRFTGMSRYNNGECAVVSKIFATTAASNSGDAIMEPGTTKNCTFAPRRVHIDFSNHDPESNAVPGASESVAARMNVIGLQNTDPSTIIPVGQSQDRPLNLALTGSRYCDALRFRPTLPAQGNLATGADMVKVKRIDARTWHLTNAGGDKAACLKNNVIVGRYHIPVDFYIVADRDLP